MATTSATSYVLRWNSTLSRKELRRRGYLSRVSGGGEITPDPPPGPVLVVGLGASSMSPAVGATVTLTATASGGTSPYTPTWFPPSGVALTGQGLVRTFTVPSGIASLTFRVSIADAAGSVQEATIVITPQGAVTQGAKFPGHVPNRVLVGMATPAGNPPPGWDEARTIVGQPIYEARRFTGGWISANAFDSMVSEADAANALPWISFKVPSNNWAGVYEKTYDSALLTLFNLCQDYGKPVLCSFHHEPAGDGDLAVWARMQEYCAWWFAGYRNVAYTGGVIVKGTYNEAHDLSLNVGGNLGWAPVGNGFWWRTANTEADAAIAYPASLIAALNACKGLVGNDFYDIDYTNMTLAMTDRAYRVPAASGVRTSRRLTRFMTWARARGVNAAGAGEYGVIDGSEMTACWQVMRANRDIWCISNYFNSMNNSDHEWRVIPADYPASSYESSKGLRDLGGDAQSAGRLAAFKQTLTESISAQYTSPL